MGLTGYNPIISQGGFILFNRWLKSNQTNVPPRKYQCDDYCTDISLRNREMDWRRRGKSWMGLRFSSELTKITSKSLSQVTCGKWNRGSGKKDQLQERYSLFLHTSNFNISFLLCKMSHLNSFGQAFVESLLGYLKSHIFPMCSFCCCFFFFLFFYFLLWVRN